MILTIHGIMITSRKSWHDTAYNSYSVVGLTATVLVMWYMGMVIRCVTALDSIGNEDTQESSLAIMLAFPCEYFMCTLYCASLSNSYCRFGLEAAIDFSKYSSVVCDQSQIVLYRQCVMVDLFCP